MGWLRLGALGRSVLRLDLVHTGVEVNGQGRLDRTKKPVGEAGEAGFWRSSMLARIEAAVNAREGCRLQVASLISLERKAQ